MLKYLLAFILITLSAQVYAQQDSIKIIQPPSSIETEDDVIYEFTEVQPKFNGEYEEYVKKNLKYPAGLREAGIQGTVYVQVLIDKDGTISAEKILRNICGGSDKAALALVNDMPKWSPAMQNGRRVKFKMIIPVKFKLD